jgi:hypothetical protein
VDERQVRLFVVGRGFLDRAELLGEDGTEPGRMSAIVLADLAVEMAAKAAVLDLPLAGNARLEREPALPVVLGALTEHWRQREQTQDDLPEVREIRRLHEVRNSVQHAGLVPSSEQVLESRVGSRRFLTWVATTWFGEDALESISRARLIENQAVRSIVEQAERAAAEEDYSTAAQHLAVAFEMARRELRAETHRGFYVRPVTSFDVGAAISEVRRGGGDTVGLGYDKFDEVLRWLVQHVERISDQVEALSLGARASDYTWFKNTFPAVGRQVRAGRALPEFVPYPVDKPITRAMYLRGLEFVTSTALHWQEFPTAEPESEPDEDGILG